MRRIYIKRTEHVDNETGEIKSSEEQSSFFVKTKHFAKFFLDGIHLLRGLSGGARDVLDIMLVEMEFDENTLYINKEDRIRLSEILDKSEYTIRNYVYELEQAGIIAKIGNNMYRVNPNIYKKGGGSNNEQVYEPKKSTGKTGESPL